MYQIVQRKMTQPPTSRTGETPTDAMSILPWLTATAAPASGRRTSIGVPPRFSSQGVFHRKGLSTRLSLPGTWRPVWLSVERALPAPTCPSPANFHRGLVVVLGG